MWKNGENQAGSLVALCLQIPSSPIHTGLCSSRFPIQINPASLRRLQTVTARGRCDIKRVGSQTERCLSDAMARQCGRGRL